MNGPITDNFSAKRKIDFPILTQKIHGKNLVYLDSAATALKPWPVIERLSHFYTYETSNVHRGAHFLADKATVAFEQTREKTAKFIGAASAEEIIFTSGTTQALNLVAHSYGLKNIKAGDEILVSEMEHHANIVPWQMLCEKTAAKLVVAPVLETGDLDLESFKKLLNNKTKIVAITHCSNTLGTYNDIQNICQLAHAVDAIVVVDGAQAITTIPVDVQKLDADFYAFSGHKLFGPFGVGVLYGKKSLLQNMPPYQGGGSMIATVSFEKTTYNDVPYRFEAGTPAIAEVIGLGAAIDYVNNIGFDEIQDHEQTLLQLATRELLTIPGLKIIGTSKHKAPIVSFSIEGLHHSDVAQILDQEAVAVRAGHHCTMPLLKKFGVSGTVRASFSIFNQSTDIAALMKGLSKAKELLS